MPELLIRLCIDLLVVSFLIRFVYNRHYRRANLFLTFYSLNIVIFLITFLLNKVEMTMGVAFGLFAVFSMLRYRTENISARDMTYVFIMIATGLVMSVGNVGWQGLLLVAFIIGLSTFLLESDLLHRREYAQDIVYNQIDLIHKDRREALLQDLKDRTGLAIHRIEIKEIDLVKSSAHIRAYYR